ncbi:hypothetical protein HZA97_04740 [Candidatus Woesearchaeota archaeon]|nr:hypothetical protein [Candidatus Woesearchaeota archaeon]
MTLNEWIGKREVFQVIMEGKPYDSVYSGVVPEFELIDEQKIDKIYLAIKKMQKCRCGGENDLLANYYNPTIQRIENAYFVHDRKRFKEEVSKLMMLMGSE